MSDDINSAGDDRASHRAAVEAGYENLADYIARWGNEEEPAKAVGMEVSREPMGNATCRKIHPKNETACGP